MIVVFDTSVLIYLLDPQTPAPTGKDNQPIRDTAARIDHLIDSLKNNRSAQILIPAPTLGETLVRGGNALAHWLEVFKSSSHFKIADFDARAAIEVALMHQDALQRYGHKKGNLAAVSWQKVKYDRQIVAIARVNQADFIYSDDGDIHKLGTTLGLTVLGLSDIPSPPPQDLDLFDLNDGAP